MHSVRTILDALLQYEGAPRRKIEQDVLTLLQPLAGTRRGALVMETSTARGPRQSEHNTLIHLRAYAAAAELVRQEL